MIGDFIRHPYYGVGKVIRIRHESELVYFFKENKNLHDGGIDPGTCEDHHGWWYYLEDIKMMKIPLGLRLLIEKRRK